LAFLRRRKKKIRPAIAITATADMTPMAALMPVLSPLDEVAIGSPGLSFPVSVETPRVVGVEIWFMVVGSPVRVVEEEVEDVDVEDVDMVEEEEVVDEILTPCASKFESETLNHELLATVEVSPCLNSMKLNWLLKERSNFDPPSVPSTLTFHRYVFALMFSVVVLVQEDL